MSVHFNTPIEGDLNYSESPEPHVTMSLRHPAGFSAEVVIPRHFDDDDAIEDMENFMESLPDLFYALLDAGIEAATEDAE